MEETSAGTCSIRKVVGVLGSSMLHAWRPVTSVDERRLTERQRAVLSRLVGCELAFDGTHGRASEWDRLTEVHTRSAETIVRSLGNAHLWVGDGHPAPPSRLRPFKIGVPKTLSSQLVEVPLDGLSLLAGVFPVGSDDFGQHYELWLRGQNFIVRFSPPMPDPKEFVEDLVKHSVSSHGEYDLNIAYLLAERCVSGGIVVLCGGDGGDEELSVQVYGEHEALLPIEKTMLAIAAECQLGKHDTFHAGAQRG